MSSVSGMKEFPAESGTGDKEYIFYIKHKRREEIQMRTIGITGGVGSGKTEILSHIRSHYPCEIILADDLAKELQEPGALCYAALVELLGADIVGRDGRIRKAAMADKIFGDSGLLEKINALIHPAVVSEILRRRDLAEKNEKIKLFFVEAALLIENGFDKICDEMWYIYAEEGIRRARLKASRGYSEEKITAIMEKQLPESIFRKTCQVVIDNSASLPESIRQIDQVLEAYQWQK